MHVAAPWLSWRLPAGAALVPEVVGGLALADPVAGPEHVERGVAVHGECLAYGVIADLERGVGKRAHLLGVYSRNLLRCEVPVSPCPTSPHDAPPAMP